MDKWWIPLYSLQAIHGVDTDICLINGGIPVVILNEKLQKFQGVITQRKEFVPGAKPGPFPVDIEEAIDVIEKIKKLNL